MYLVAQSSKKISITGTIVDNTTNTPLEFATAILLKSNTIVTGVSTNEKGEFNLRATKGSYTIRLEFIGYKSVELPTKHYAKNQQLGNIKLDEESARLDEIEITAEKSTVNLQLDKKCLM